MEEQTNFDNFIHGKADFNKYTGWIMTVGELREAIKTWSDETHVKLAFRGKTPSGRPINMTMNIECIGNSCIYIEGRQENLIYINGNDY